MSWIVKTSAYSHRNSRLAVEIKVNSQSISDNSTLLSYRVYADNDGDSSSYVAYYSRSVTINGTTVYSASNRINGYKNQTLKSGTIRIPHNADGTKSINISLGADIYASSGNYKSGSQSITLPRIDRGIYDVSLPSGWVDLAGQKTITYKKYNSNTTVKVRWQYWSNATNSRTAEYVIRDTNGNSLDDGYTSGTPFAFQEDLINAIHNDKPNYKTATVYITIRAYVGNNVIQTIDRTINLNLKVEAPSLSITSKFTGTNQSLLGSSKRGLVGVHTLDISSSIQVKNGANISEVELTYDGRTYTNKTGEFKIYPNSIGTKSISVKAVDTRGYQRIVTDSVTVLNYKKPYVTHRGYRLDGSNESPLGTTGEITGTVHIYDVKNMNGVSINQAYYTLNLESTKRTTPNILYRMSLPISDFRKYEIKGEDKFSISKTSGEIPVGEAPLVLGQKGIGVGMVPGDGDGLWVKDDINAKGINYTTPSYFTDQVQWGAGITNQVACQYGRLGIVRFNYAPKGKWSVRETRIPSQYQPMFYSVASVSTSASSTAMQKGISAYMDSNGYITITCEPNYQSPECMFYFVYVIRS